MGCGISLLILGMDELSDEEKETLGCSCSPDQVPVQNFSNVAEQFTGRKPGSYVQLEKLFVALKKFFGREI